MLRGGERALTTTQDAQKGAVAPASIAPAIPCPYCKKPMVGAVLKAWGKFYYSCKNPDCLIEEVEISMRLEHTPAGKLFNRQPTPQGDAPR
jgi:hypothetical protein